jgi:hypothetical protein
MGVVNPGEEIARGLVSMNSDGKKEFAHRLNADGTFDSICLDCYRTVSSANREEDLLKGEKKHSCPADDLVVDGKPGSPSRRG